MPGTRDMALHKIHKVPAFKELTFYCHLLPIFFLKCSFFSSNSPWNEP